MKERNTEKERQEEALNSQRDKKDSILESFFSKHKDTYLHCLFIFTICFVYFLFQYLEFYKFAQNPQNLINDTLILTSYDSYYYAKFAKEFALSNIKEQLSLLSSIPPLSILGWILSAVFKETAFTYSSVVFGVIFGIIMYVCILQILQFTNTESTTQNKILALIGSMLSLLAPHYFQRTIIGYFDTDMLILSLPLLSILFLWKYILQGRSYSLLAFGIFSIASINWHNGISSILLSSFMLYLLYATIKKELQLDIISVFLIALTPFSYSFVALFIIFVLKKYKYLILVISIIYAYYFGLFNPIISQVNAYLFGEIQHSNSYIYTSVVNLILETTPATFIDMASRSGGIIVFICGIFGFCVIGLIFALKNRNFAYIYLLLIPFLLLGIASFKLGVRFSMFLSPIIAIGIVLLIAFLLHKLQKYKNIILGMSIIALGLFIACMKYEIPQPILSKSEIQSLQKLPIKNGDIAFSWWDYGYAISYFTESITLLDGGRHAGIISYPIAEILLNTNQRFAKNLSIKLAQNMKSMEKSQWNFIFTNSLNNQTPLEYIKTLENTNIKKDSNYDIFWIIPYRMIPLVANINKFRNINPQNGKTLQNSGIFNFKNNVLTIDETYKNSNVLQWILFNNNKEMELILKNDKIVVYKIKD